MELQLRLPGDWPVGQHRHAPPVPAGEDLESVLVWLQVVEINAWISSTLPAHIAADVHDPHRGDRSVTHETLPVRCAITRQRGLDTKAHQQLPSKLLATLFEHAAIFRNQA